MHTQLFAPVNEDFMVLVVRSYVPWTPLVERVLVTGRACTTLPFPRYRIACATGRRTLCGAERVVLKSIHKGGVAITVVTNTVVLMRATLVVNAVRVKAQARARPRCLPWHLSLPASSFLFIDDDVQVDDIKCM